MRFQIEKRCCGSEVIASQSWKSYKKWMLGGGRCDVEVVRPQTRNKMNATAWWVSLQPILTSHAKKRWKFRRLPFLCTRQVHPQISQKFHSGGGCPLEVGLDEFFDSSRTNVLLSHKHHVDCAQAERTAFHYVFVEIEQKISGEIAWFSGAQKQPCGRCCATAVRSILRVRGSSFQEKMCLGSPK